MRYNPPPNWPPPPPGWEPGATWTPDPAWPPPPPGWQLFTDDEPPVTPEADDPAAESVAAAPSQSSTPPMLTEIAADQLSVDHLSVRAMAKWDDENRYKIGTIIGVSADLATVTVELSGSAAITFPRDQSVGSPTGPRLFVVT